LIESGPIGGAVFTALLVHDDPSIRIRVRNALADAGCLDILAVDSAQEAATCAADADPRPDAIVVDLDRGDLSEVETLAASFRDIPVIVLCSDLAAELAFAAGAADCVIKPLRSRELGARIRETLRRRREVAGSEKRARRLSDAIVALQREKQDLERLVCVDVLTGIANRRHTLALLEAEWRRSARERSPMACVMIDLDYYHAYNEQYGHLGGDACLQRVAEAMVACLRRPSDFLGRYGGEEFLAVLPNTDAAGAKVVADRLRAAVEALGVPHSASMCSRVVTITGGFAAIKVLGDLPVDDLIKAADAALLRAKASGRNRIEGDAPLVRPSLVSVHTSKRFAPVFADPWFADRIPPFLTEVRADLRVIGELTGIDDLAPVLSIAHVLKASAKEFGLLVISRLADDLEQAASVADVSAIRALSDEILQYVLHVQVIYRRPTAGPISASVATAS
jgi:diguanylate cyclase (GGDEF)-like protein